MKRIALYFIGLLFIFSCGSDKNQNTSSTSTLTSGPPPAIEVIVLGTAQDAGFPQIACKKQCCKDLLANQLKGDFVSSLGLIDRNTGKKYVFDATPDFPNQLSALNVIEPSTQGQSPSGIFLTHAHMGHYTGLMHLGREAMGAKEVPVYVMPRMQAYLQSSGPWSQLIELKNIDLKPMSNGQSIMLSQELAVTPFLVPHRDEFSETVGFRIQGPSKSLLFIPDIDKWSKWKTDILKAIKSNDYAYLDGTFYKNGEIFGRDMSEIPHPFIEESLSLFENVQNKDKVRFIHFNHTNPVLDESSEASKAVESLGFSIARTGDRIAL